MSIDKVLFLLVLLNIKSESLDKYFKNMFLFCLYLYLLNSSFSNNFSGTLAPSLSKDKSGIDLIYATFWFYPSDIQELLPEDKECIASRMNLEKERFEPSSM